MTETTTITTDDAAELAHTYHWFMRDLHAEDHAGVCIYGDWLLSMQTRMGVTLVDPDQLKIIIRNAVMMFEAAE